MNTFDCELYNSVINIESIFMLLKKLICGFLFIILFSGCAQNAALLAPAYTFASTGNAYQAGLSFGSNKVVKNLTGKTTVQNIKNIVSESDTKDKINKANEINQEKFFALVKNRIENTRKVINLSNQ